MNEAFEIVHQITERIGKPVRFRDAKYLASFDFPLEEKCRVIRKVIEKGGAENIYSALYFRQAFIEAETNYHKGSLPKKDSLFVRVSSVLSSTGIAGD